MKNTLSIFTILLLGCFFSAAAQQKESIRTNKLNRQEMFKHWSNGMDRKINSHDKLLKNSDHPISVSDLTEFQELPDQDPKAICFETVPIALSNGSIMILYTSWDGVGFTADDSLFCIISTDGGQTWGMKKTITLSPFNSLYHLTAMQTNSGRIIATWTDYSSTAVTKMIYSDDEGSTWSSVISVSSSYPAWYPSISQSIANTIYLSYSIDKSGNFSYYGDIVFRTSTDDGITWKAEKVLSGSQVSQNMGSIIPDTGNGLLAIYSRLINGSWGIVKRTSTNGGDTWSIFETIILDGLLNDDNSRVIRINADTLCLLYWQWSSDYDFRYYDFYYMMSGDNGSTWNNPVQFTRYAGSDGFVSNLCLYNSKPFVSFVSTRWQSIYNVPHVWYGTIGMTQDDGPPPAVNYSAAYQYYFAPGKEETILGYIKDESGVEDAQVNISLNGGAEYSLQMFDDGEHNDWGAGDGIYGIPVGPFSVGDHLDYNFSVTDIDSNTINVHGFSTDVVHHGNPINPNKGFEESPVGVISGNITGWGFWTAPSASALFEVIDDTVKEGNRALKVQVSNLGENDWDILAVNEPYNLEPNVPYGYSVWAKADKNNTFVDFTLGEVEGSYFSEWLIAYNVTLTTEWQEYFFDFFPQLSTGRSRISFSLDANSTSLPIKFYIDDLRIVKLGSIVVPVELTSFLGNNIKGDVILNWSTASEINNRIFEIERRKENTDFLMIGFVEGKGTTTEQQEYSFIDKNITAGKYFYRLKQVDFDGTFEYSNEIELNAAPVSFSLQQNYPNPFNPSTKITYSIPQKSLVTIKVYNSLGEELSELVNEEKEGGMYEVDFDAPELSSGVYFYKIEAGDFVQIKKMILLR